MDTKLSLKNLYRITYFHYPILLALGMTLFTIHNLKPINDLQLLAEITMCLWSTLVSLSFYFPMFFIHYKSKEKSEQ